MEPKELPTCPHCNTPMAFLQRKDFTTNPSTLIFREDGPILDLYKCETCRRVEFFMPQEPETEPAFPSVWTTHRCPVCRFECSVYLDTCPNCRAPIPANPDGDGAASAAQTPQPSQPPEPAASEKPPRKRGWFRKKDADPWE